MKIIALSNQKGGVAKTTTTLNVAAGLALDGFRVLTVDLDSQGSLTFAAGIARGELTADETVYGVIAGNTKAADAIIKTELGFDILPANYHLSSADLTLGGMVAREKLLKKSLKGLNYDIILIDCPAALNLLTLNALTAAEKVYIPIEPEMYGIEGVSMLMDTIERTQEDINPGLEIGGVIITRYDKRSNITKECTRVLEDQFGEVVFNTRIRANIKLKETAVWKESIFEHAPKSYGAIDYRKLTNEIIEREGLVNGSKKG